MQWQCSQCGTNNLEYLEDCRNCGMGKGGIVKGQQRFEEWKKQNSEAAEETIKTNEALKSIFVSTGNIKEPYEIVDTIFALDFHSAEGFWIKRVNPGVAFDRVKMNLRQNCHDIGGNAVINCMFEYRMTSAKDSINRSAENEFVSGFTESLLGVTPGIANKQVIEIFAYGTAVKLKKSDED